MVNAYRAWTGDWRVVVTVLGWLMVIGGVMRIVLPRLTAGLATAICFRLTRHDYCQAAGLMLHRAVVAASQHL
jgi:hypothetical protein